MKRECIVCDTMRCKVCANTCNAEATVTPELKSLEQMIAAYTTPKEGLDSKKASLKRYLNAFATEDLENAITDATLARCPKCKNGVHLHQRRLSRTARKKWKECLLKKKEEIQSCKGKSFEDLYDLIAQWKPKGIGPLALYDTALRISACLGCLPREYVYVHASAQIPGGTKGKGRYPYRDFPSEFRAGKLTAYDAEDFLCIFQESMKGIPSIKKAFQQLLNKSY